MDRKTARTLDDPAPRIRRRFTFLKQTASNRVVLDGNRTANRDRARTRLLRVGGGSGKRVDEATDAFAMDALIFCVCSKNINGVIDPIRSDPHPVRACVGIRNVTACRARFG